MDAVFQTIDTDQAALNKRFRDALQAERQHLAAERRALDAERRAHQQEKEQWAAGVEREKAVRMQELAEQQVKFAAKVAAFEHQVKEAEARYRDPSSIIQLNVGGKKFETLRDTLTKVEGSMLQAMFSGRHPITKDKKGRAFLDRDPAMFQLILNFLRTDMLPTSLDQTQQSLFEAELSFFQLAEEVITPAVAPTPTLLWALNRNVQVLDYGRSIKKSWGGSSWNCNVLALTGFSKGVHHWSIRRDVDMASNGLMVGIASSSLDPTATNAYSVDGLYFFCYSTGQLYGKYPQGGASVSGNAYGAPVTRAGDIVTVQLDCDAHTLSFSINGTSCGIAYSSLPAIEWYPCVLLFDQGEQVSFVDK